MTLDEIRNLVIRCDQTAEHYWSSSKDKAYTVWREYNRLPAYGDNQNQEFWRFQIDRFTEIENDPVAAQILDTLSHTEGVAFEYHVDFEGQMGRGGLIHHIFDCQG